MDNPGHPIKYYLFLILFPLVIHSQTIKPDYKSLSEKIIFDSSHVYNLVFNDGSELLCNIVGFDSASLNFKALSGFEGNVELNSISKIKLVRGEWKDNEYKVENPHSHHLVIFPTAETLPQGSIYMSISEVLFWSLTFAPTDFINVGAGSPMIPGAFFSSLYGYVKLRLLNYEGFHLSVGGVAVTALENMSSSSFIAGSAIYDKVKVTLSYYTNFDQFEMLNFGGEISLNNRMSLITEHDFFTVDQSALHIYGVRFNGNSFGTDFGFIYLSDENKNSRPFPWLGIYYKF